MSTPHTSVTLNSATGKWTLLATILASAMAFIDTTALNVILPSLQRDLDASATELFWVLNSYLLMLAALIILGGSLGDKLGRVRVFKFGILVFIVGSLLCGLSPTIELLIISRTIQGIGGAFMIPGSLSVISAVFSLDEKGKAIGTWSAATTIVTICGPVLGGALADIGLWRLIFFINIPIGIFAYYALAKKVPESRESSSGSIDWKGALTLVASLGLLTFGFLEMPELGYAHPIVIFCIVIGFGLMVLFPFIENQQKDPMVPLSLFRNNTFTGVNLQSFFLYAALGIIILFLSLNIIQIQGYSQLQAGLTFLPFSLTMVLLARRMGKLTDKYGARRFLIIGPAITGTGMLILAQVGLTEGPSDYWTTFFPGFMVFAIGMSITVVPLTTAVMTSVDVERSGIASGINNSVTRVSGTFANAIIGVIAIFYFSQYVLQELEALNTGEQIMIEVAAETVNLGAASVPAGLDTIQSTNIGNLYTEGFVDTYKLVGLVSAALAYLSALIAVVLIKETKKDG